MNGRQRSGAAAAVHHQRQLSDNLLDMSSSNGRWLQSTGLPHFQPSSNDYGYYGGGQGARGYQNAQRNDFFGEPTTPQYGSRPSSQRRNNDESEFSPGLLDLHSFDTELLPEIPVSSQLDGPSMFNPSQSQSFDDFEAYNKQPNRSRALADNLAAEKEKMNAVAKIKVVVRKRPLNKKEENIIDTHSNCLTVHETKVKVDLTAYVEKHEFVFNAVLDEEVSNDERIEATCFAYGQTGSGKTYTMKPLPLKASRDILRLMHHTYRNQGFQLFVSFFEIYGGKLYDLLSERKKLCMREDGKQQVCIVGLQEYRVSDTDAIVELIERGSATRSTGTTGANEESSRSHAILQLAVNRDCPWNQSKPPRLVGKLSFIDLAGSERGADTTDNDKQTRLEGAEINKSLLALKECIRALDNDQGHIPFRGSKLTEVLRDSFMGNSRTVMISCISPSSGSCEHTLNTLRYADRVKSLSKGNGSKKDVSSSTMNLRESTKIPLSSALPTPSNYEDDVNEMWTEENDDFDASDYEQEKQMWKKNVKPEVSYAQERIPKPNIPMKSRDMPRPDMKKSNSDDNLNALLQEEEDLVNAHRKQVEDTMNIVKEEMNLLVEADQPGNQLDGYISRLNTILSQKAAGILQLQNRLAHFQKRLREHNVLASTTTGY
uniref:Kinesin-like protein n=1 Tax=Brassica campestris TaxID=3711 RepID=M4E341_BRACM